MNICLDDFDVSGAVVVSVKELKRWKTLQNLCDLYSSTAFCFLELEALQ